MRDVSGKVGELRESRPPSEVNPFGSLMEENRRGRYLKKGNRN
jgi:hypothetical protein